MTDAPSQERIDALLEALRLDTPVIALYESADIEAFKAAGQARGDELLLRVLCTLA